MQRNQNLESVFGIYIENWGFLIVKICFFCKVINWVKKIWYQEVLFLIIICLKEVNGGEY